jgi:chemotaxis signal transduction protein
MTLPAVPNGPPVDRVDDIPRIMDAINQAIQEALREHKRIGNPVAIWRDGQVVWLQPDEILVDDED